jgi:SpoVK/Ycf46/Vps4 family AAA+-type ATPase
MHNLQKILDERDRHFAPVYNNKKRSRTHLTNILYKLDNNYTNLDTDPFIKKALTSGIVPRTLTINKEKVIINKEINTLSELIELLNDYPIVSNAEYNIDMERIQKIKEPLIELNNLIGLHDLKNNILDQILFYIQDFHKTSGMDYMHTVLYGSPGTGKTEVAKIIGKIFCQLGILEKKTFKKVVRSDLIAGYLGQTAIKTTKVIEEALGGVLFIDEAYALGNSEKRDSFAKECIDTLCEALSNHKDKIIVIIAGYEEELDRCFFSYNQGLKSRFPWVFKTDKYSATDLRDIFVKKVNDIGWSLNDDINIKFFEDNMKLFPYYGRDMEILFLKTKIAHGRRVFCKPMEDKTKLNLTDLEKGFELFKKHSKKEEDNIPPPYTMYN